mgnify:CR=1 FL=1
MTTVMFDPAVNAREDPTKTSPPVTFPFNMLVDATMPSASAVNKIFPPEVVIFPFKVKFPVTVVKFTVPVAFILPACIAPAVVICALLALRMLMLPVKILLVLAKTILPFAALRVVMPVTLSTPKPLSVILPPRDNKLKSVALIVPLIAMAVPPATLLPPMVVVALV